MQVTGSTKLIEQDRNVWAQELRPWERMFGALGYIVLETVNLFIPVTLVWLKHPERIGEIALSSAQAWVLDESRSKRGPVRYCIQRGYPTANTFLDGLIRRNLPVCDWLWPVVQWAEDRVASGRQRPDWLIAEHRIQMSRDRAGLLSLGVAPFAFTAEEDDAGRSWLRSLGWQDGEPFVCLLVRDSVYLDEELKGIAAGGFSHHGYRDSDIATYGPAAEWLADQCAWVLRMGKMMAKPLVTGHRRVVDYAFREDRSDFLDVWLFANCDLCISTGTGPDMIADVYRRPLLTVNLLPAIGLWSWSNAVTAPKPLVWSNTGRRLSVEELVSATWLRGESYAEHGIEIRDLNAETIRGIVQEAWSRLNGDWTETPEDGRRDRAAWQALESHPEYADWHGYRHPSARFSSVWLRQLEAELATHTQPEHE